MEENKINIKDYVSLNKSYLDKQSEIENKIKEELLSNAEKYPAGAEELYFFDYGKDLSPDEEDKVSIIESLIVERFKDDYNELAMLREQILSLVGHVGFTNEGENSSEN